jgi:TolB-like protein
MGSKLLVGALLVVILALAGFICFQNGAHSATHVSSQNKAQTVTNNSVDRVPPPALFKETTMAAPVGRSPVVAVIDFAVSSDDVQLAKLSQEIRVVLEQKLGDQGLAIVDRSKLSEALRGAKLTMAGIADPESAKQLGKVLNADYIISSRMSELAGTLIVTIRAIDTETSQIVSVGADAKKEQLSESLTKAAESLAAKLKTIRASAPFGTAKVVKLPPGPRPKVMLLFREEHLTRHVPDPASETAFARFFLNNGFVMIDSAVSVATQSDDSQMKAFKTDLQALAKVGLDKQADVIILGEAFSELGTGVEGFVTCRARVEVKAVNTRTVELIAYDSSEAGASDLAEHVAGKTAIQNAANKLAPAIASSIIERWQSAPGAK